MQILPIGAMRPDWKLFYKGCTEILDLDVDGLLRKRGIDNNHPGAMLSILGICPILITFEMSFEEFAGYQAILDNVHIYDTTRNGYIGTAMVSLEVAKSLPGLEGLGSW